MKKILPFLPLAAIIVVSLLLRLWNINWDNGYHLHPDERAILLFSIPLQFPTTIENFFSSQSSWNPHFFAYGSFPLYLLKVIASLGGIFYTELSSYASMHIVGRMISALFDTGTVVVIYLLTKKLFSKHMALLAAFFYAISVLPIQLSHFYAVDTILTFYVFFLLYQLIRFYQNPSKKKAIGIGILLGFALATKTSAFVLIAAIGVAISLDFLLVFLKQPHKPHVWFPHIPTFLQRLLIEGASIVLATLVTFFLLEPYAFITFQEFWNQTLQQQAMTKSAFTFPYTLQYVGKIPYVYELHNILLWGLGLILGIPALMGIFSLHIQLLRRKILHWQQWCILLSFFWIYFLLVGSFAIGFMRYMLPLYPFFSLFAAFFILTLFQTLYQKHKRLSLILFILFLFSSVIWTLSFMHIYQKPPTKVTASEWIIRNIPPKKTLAVEHWDDALPLSNQQLYTLETLELYNPDTEEKWEKINKQLDSSDYIILASNRLYTPLQKLSNCDRLPLYYCYPKTAAYYQKLFSNRLGFKKVAQFSVYPTIPFLNIPLDDTNADESFTVYDHPTVLIFQKTTPAFKP